MARVAGHRRPPSRWPSCRSELTVDRSAGRPDERGEIADIRATAAPVTMVMTCSVGVSVGTAAVLASGMVSYATWVPLDENTASPGRRWRRTADSCGSPCHQTRIASRRCRSVVAKHDVSEARPDVAQGLVLAVVGGDRVRVAGLMVAENADCICMSKEPHPQPPDGTRAMQSPRGPADQVVAQDSPARPRSVVRIGDAVGDNRGGSARAHHDDPVGDRPAPRQLWRMRTTRIRADHDPRGVLGTDQPDRTGRRELVLGAVLLTQYAAPLRRSSRPASG